MLKRLPLVIRIDETQTRKLDLLKALRVNRYSLDRELLEQPAKYMYWAALYAACEAKVSKIIEVKGQIEARLYTKYSSRNSGGRVRDIQELVNTDPKIKLLDRKLRHWEDAARLLKFAEKAWSQRLSSLQSYSANQRREKHEEE